MTTALLILAFTFLDTVTTLFGLHYLGGVELNPIYHVLTPAAFWLIKWILAVVFAAFAWTQWKYLPIWWKWALWGGAIIPAIASLNNAIHMALWSWGF